MTRRCMKWIEYLHAALIFALPVPMLYAIINFSDPAGTVVFYSKCLFIIIPIILTDVAIKKVKSLISYLLICGALFAGVYGVTIAVPNILSGKGYLEGYALCYGVVMLLETVFVSLIRMGDRLREAKWRKENDLFATKEISILERPNMVVLCYFGAMYLIGICFYTKPLCDIAFFSAVVYPFLVFLYLHLESTRDYLKINHRTRGIPVKRLYRISSVMFALFVLLLFVGMLPGIFLSGHRRYTDIRTWFRDVKPVPVVDGSGSEMMWTPYGDMDMNEFLYGDEPPPEPSVVIEAIFWILGVLCVIVFVYGVVLAVRQLLKDFRNSRDENGDLVEEIKEDSASVKEDILNLRRRHRVDSEIEKIRRQYRKTIRKHRKDRPAPFESPTEIEENAGLKEDEKMRQLHKEYESARYKLLKKE